MRKKKYMMSMYIKQNFLKKTFIPLPLLVTKRFLLMCFLVMPKDVWVEEGFTAEWAHQPHS